MDRSRSLVADALERSGVRVQTLVMLRWIAIAGQMATIAVVGFYLHFPLPWAALISAIAAAAVLNIGLATLYPRNARLEGREALLHLMFDMAQAGIMLFLTGGLANPFAVLLVVPITISATLLSARAMLVMMALGLVILVIEAQMPLPLPWRGAPMVIPEVYHLGVFVAIANGMLFIAGYVWLVSAESRRRAQALVATQAALERESRLSALGALAAAAAHELGGPLGTITLIAHELVEQLGNDPDFGDDVRLLEAEAARSRAILVGIARRAEAEDPFPLLTVEVLLHEVTHGVAPARVPIDIDTAAAPELRLRRTPELLHGLSNLVSNAVRHAGSKVELRLEASSSEIRLRISDDGPGFDRDLLPHLGEPYLGPSRSRAGSTGLGIFIATTLLERTGAQLEFSNLSHGGARVDIRWLRSHIEATPGLNVR